MELGLLDQVKVSLGSRRAEIRVDGGGDAVVQVQGGLQEAGHRGQYNTPSLLLRKYTSKFI